MSDGLIAIIGASCRFPGADGIEAYWRLLSEGIDAVGRIDDARWSTRFFYHPGRAEAGKSYTWAAGLIDGIDRFEPAFFGISPREAAQMDPQQRPENVVQVNGGERHRAEGVIVRGGRGGQV